MVNLVDDKIIFYCPTFCVSVKITIIFYDNAPSFKLNCEVTLSLG
jgi:hypothetical protein